MKSFNSLLPGQRIIKSGLSVSISIYILKILTSDPSLYFYASIAAIMTVQNTVEKSRRIGITRFLGTILGGTIAILFILLTNVMGVEVDNVIVIFFAIVIAMRLCVALNIKEGIVVCCILYLSSVSIQMDNNYIQYVFYRLLATTLGIIIAILINSIDLKREKLKH